MVFQAAAAAAAASTLSLIVAACSGSLVGAFTSPIVPLAPRPSQHAVLDAKACDEDADGYGTTNLSRRSALSNLLSVTALATTTSFINVKAAHAAVDVSQLQPVEMQLFTDPLFSLNVPKRYYKLRRSAKGDLPDEKTGKGRRGSSIFTAGDMSKAEVLAVERFPIRALLEEAGVNPEAIDEKEITTIAKIGSPQTVAELLTLRRDKDKPGSANRAIVQKDTVSVSEDGKTLSFSLRAKIDVQKPELLMEQMGVTELFRETVAKATLEGEDGNVMAVFGSALSQDFEGPDGVALRDSIDSFRALKGAS